MRVNLFQLKPGHILMNHVIGKSGRTLMPKHTKLTEKHIEVLKHFLIDEVDISTRPIVERESETRTNHVDKSIYKEERQDHSSLINDYLHFVQEYKKLFQKWQNNFAVDMPKLRALFIPLLDHLDDETLNIYVLNKYMTKSDYVYYHHVSLGLLSAKLAKSMNLERREWLQVGLAGLLSDSGLARLDAKIPGKQAQLNRSEMEIFREHPRHSYFLIESIPTVSKKVKLAILQHHERLDGSGYPVGLKSDKIHLYARIIAVCDMYYTKVNNPFTKDSKSPFHAIKEVQTMQYSKLDTSVVHHFIRGFTKNMVGIKVRLSNQKIGEVIFINDENLDQPIIKLEEEKIISLENENELFISEII